MSKRMQKVLTFASVFGLMAAPVVGLVSPASAATVTDASDTMSRLQVSTASDHTIEFTTPTGVVAGETMTFTFPAGFTMTTIVAADVDVADDTVDLTTAADCTGSEEAGISVSGQILTVEICTGDGGDIAAASVVEVQIGTNAGGSNQITNHATADSYEIAIGGTQTDTGSVEIAVVDDDTVNVTGYIDTFFTFDIDTTTDTDATTEDTQCDAAGGVSPCDSHGGATDDSGYVVDLGELTTSSVNDSGDSVLHADGLTGVINSIAFDLSTNANGGVAVTVLSANGVLDNEADDPATTDNIPSVSSETALSGGDGLYGIYFLTDNVAGSGGAFTIGADYDGGAAETAGPVSSGSITEIFNTSSNPLDDGRVLFEVLATPDSINGTGTYTDELTFIATATF